MENKNVIADAGFLVALFPLVDENHEWAVSQAKANPPPWATFEAVLSEADHLLKPHACSQLRLACRRGALKIRGLNPGGIERVLDLMEKYSDTPLSIADACVVRLSELEERSLVLTTDSDFRVYRRFGRRVIPSQIP